MRESENDSLIFSKYKAYILEENLILNRILINQNETTLEEPS